jgi:hypothetical protein
VLITEYFQEIDSEIADCIHVVEATVTKDRRSLHIGIIEGQLLFSDESALHFIEFVNTKETIELYKYSYHYQGCNGALIFRYDMAPHHKEIGAFPHHKHLASGKIIGVSVPTLERVLEDIGDLIEQEMGDG